MKLSNREPPCARKRDSRWTNTNLKRHKAGAQTSGGRRLQVPQGYTYVELHRHAGEAFRGDRARGKRQTEATLPAALSGSESKAPGSAGGYLLEQKPFHCAAWRTSIIRVVSDCEYTAGAVGICRVWGVEPRSQVVVINLEEVAFPIDFKERNIMLVVRVVVRVEFLELANREKHLGSSPLVKFRY